MHKSLQLLFLTCVGGVYGETFDYVIAGAGTAGLVIANRLSSNPAITVAVVETGDDVRQNADVQTINFSFTSFNTSINWLYPSVTSAALGSRNLTYRAGKAWGGTSSVNGMVYIRGDKAQYDAWEDLGNKGWNWDSVFSYYKKGEHFITPTSAQIANGATYDASAHGTTGPLDLGFPFTVSNSSFHDKARDTWKVLGLDSITDLNSGDSHGFDTAPMTLDPPAGVREDSARAYYTPAEARSNLKIIKGTVKRITWADAPGRTAVANGFEYVTPSGELVKIGARKEVVLSASAYRNPLILEGSGVGNPKILSKLGIKIKVKLPGVGESMQDHNIIAMTYALKSSLDGGRIPYATLPTAQDVFGNKTASLAASTSAKLAEWAKALSDLSDGAISPSAIEKRFRIQHDLIFKKNVTVGELFPTNTGTGILAQFWTSMPFSWGSVHLGSKDKFNEPSITPNLFSATDFDLDMLAAVGRLSQKSFATPPLSDLIADNVSPGYSKLPLNASDDQWGTFLKGNVLNALHVVGSCSMLPRELGGVVDEKVTVHGTRNVRVVDASIIPMQLSGHTMAPVYAVAEKAADIILAEWK
ncbi:GMC oxidoreductase [Lentithecium fluviatile CBS 122367]|uniref:GMC oxidoreductase n=1 Tax=Lentithecium fluviatile CBS 122367 TaxID=1168545 RepID=A0A6G1IKE1_9PLEO|nr:GMC oxidoreductase [Lentithecium fluviatile CBS 122367]